MLNFYGSEYWIYLIIVVSVIRPFSIIIIIYNRSNYVCYYNSTREMIFQELGLKPQESLTPWYRLVSPYGILWYCYLWLFKCTSCSYVYINKYMFQWLYTEAKRFQTIYLQHCAQRHNTIIVLFVCIYRLATNGNAYCPECSTHMAYNSVSLETYM